MLIIRTMQLLKGSTGHVLLLAVTALIVGLAHGQDQYPSKPVHVIVPTGAGSAPDVLVRTMGQKLLPQWGQAVVVENRPGASGMIGADTVAKAQADGYTLLMAWDGMMSINPILYRKISYSPQQDFVPITAVGRVEFALVAHPSFAASTVLELIAAAKAQPGKINYASPGAGEAHHIAMEALKSQAAIDLVHVAYKGGPAALNDVLAGHVSVAFIGLTPALPHIRAGKLKILAVLGEKRSQLLPDVPTVAESLPGYSVQGSWLGFFAPARTPVDIVLKLNRDINALLSIDEIRKFLFEQGIVPMGTTSDEFAKLVRDDTARFRQIIDRANIRLD
jgi:tripartite-type tricarboxylate transporter receptor subunit TctC